jgi:antitoxin ParD1/3/4
MARQSISFTSPNDDWLKSQVESEEYTSKSDVVNDLIRRAREIEAIRARLIHAEQSGFTAQGQTEILALAKEEARRNGEL